MEVFHRWGFPFSLMLDIIHYWIRYLLHTQHELF